MEINLKPVMAHKKKIVGGGIVAAIIAGLMSIGGCVATYNHKIVGPQAIQMEESYRVELQTDDFILKMKNLEQERIK